MDNIIHRPLAADCRHGIIADISGKADTVISKTHKKRSILNSIDEIKDAAKGIMDEYKLCRTESKDDSLFAILKTVKQLADYASMLCRRTHPDTEIPERIIGRSDGIFVMHMRKNIEVNLPDSKYSVDCLARDMGMSRTSLNRRTRQVLGTSPNNYIKRVRLEKAAILLRSCSMKINEVCYTVGFNTPSYFTKTFRKEFGYNPNEMKMQECSVGK